MPSFERITDLIDDPPFELSDTDKAVLLTAEEDSSPHTWEEIKSKIGLLLICSAAPENDL